MSAFIDASVIVAIVTRESDAELLAARVNAADTPLYVSSIALYEATFGVARKKAPAGVRASAEMIAEAWRSVSAVVREIGAVEIPLADEVTTGAIDASARFGKVVGHPARLNMGDCFAYACARARNVPLLYKGDDFAKTDIPAA